MKATKAHLYYGARRYPVSPENLPELPLESVIKTAR